MTAHPETPLVFIVDAEAVNCRLFEAKLTRNHEFRVICTTTGAAAERLAAQEPFAVLLWDMRVHETLLFLPRIRAYCPQSALMLTTTDDRPILPLALQRLDIADVLVKPLNLDTLLHKVRHAVAAVRQKTTATPLELVSVGQQITLQRETGTCTTRVVSFALDTFAVAAPPRIEAPADFAPGAFVQAAFSADDAVYSFETTILERIETPVPQWQIAMPTILHREQRRKYPRAVVQTAVILNPPADTANPAAIQAVTHDLSLGGFAVVSEQEIQTGTQVTFALSPRGQESLTGVGQVVRAAPRTSEPLESVPQYDVAVEFTFLPPLAHQQLRSLIEKTEE